MSKTCVDCGNILDDDAPRQHRYGKTWLRGRCRNCESKVSARNRRIAILRNYPMNILLIKQQLAEEKLSEIKNEIKRRQK